MSESSDNRPPGLTKRHKRDKSQKDQMGKAAASAAELPPAPAVVLVGTQMGENIGSAARVMLNFGLTDLRLVAPRDGWPNQRAYALGSGAAGLLDQAKVFETTEEAVADLTYILSATARRRELEIPVIGTDKVGEAMQAEINKGGKPGIMFGPEKAGLTNEDVVLSDAIVTYPINPGFQSLNLSMAVGVFSFLWGSRTGGEPPEFFDRDVEVAPRKDLMGLFEHLEDELEDSGFFYPPEKRPIMVNNIRAPLTRSSMTTQEVRTWRGIVKALAKGRGRSK